MCVAALVTSACTPGADSPTEESATPAVTSPAAEQPEAPSPVEPPTANEALRGEVSRAGGPAEHGGCEWAGAYMGRFGGEAPDVAGEVVTVRLESDGRWFVESGAAKTRGTWTRDDDTLAIVDELTIGASADCGRTPGRYLLRHTNDCGTDALTVHEDTCEARRLRMHQLILERR